MKILKFGGTSVGTAESIQNVKDIIRSQYERKIIVLSAMSGVTNDLIGLWDSFRYRDKAALAKRKVVLERKHLNLIRALFSSLEDRRRVETGFLQISSRLDKVLEEVYSTKLESVVLTFGETFLSYIFSEYLKAEGLHNILLDAKKFMRISNAENPDLEEVGNLLKEHLAQQEHSEIYITQGFVCTDELGAIKTLKRGGSDYSATIIAGALGAREVQIWTDIDGFHNNDPRFVEHTTALSHLTFEEAAELAYFGAKILHPHTVSPVKGKDIPIYLKNTFTPEAPGTLISSAFGEKGLKAISAKDGITAIRIKSNKMLMAHGFLKKIFEVFDRQKTAIDMITTSEIAISLTIDDTTHLDSILKDLESYGEISVDHNFSIICVVGEEVIRDQKTFRLFEIIGEIPVRMISYGGSSHNISLLVPSEEKANTLQLLNKKLFEQESSIS